MLAKKSVPHYKDNRAQSNTIRWSDNNASKYNIQKYYSNILPLYGSWGNTTGTSSSQYNATLMKAIHYISIPPT
jgi:hypothetical protein